MKIVYLALLQQNYECLLTLSVWTDSGEVDYATGVVLEDPLSLTEFKLSAAAVLCEKQPYTLLQLPFKSTGGESLISQRYSLVGEFL